MCLDSANIFFCVFFSITVIALNTAQMVPSLDNQSSWTELLNLFYVTPVIFDNLFAP